MKYTIPRIKFFSSDPDKDLNAELVKAGVATTGIGAGIGAGLGRWGKKSSGIKKKALEEIGTIRESQSALKELVEEKIKEIKNLPKARMEDIKNELRQILSTGKYKDLPREKKERVNELNEKLKSGKIGAPSKKTLEKKIKDVEKKLAESLKPKEAKISEISKKASKAVKKNTLKGAGKGALYAGLGASALGYGVKKLTD